MSFTTKDRVAIICGSAPCVKEEFEIVSKARPDAVIIGINEAIQVIKCDILMTYHLLEVGMFIDKSLNENIEVHTSKGYREELKPLADKFWNVKGGATSAIDAVQMCQQMEFKEIILVGCPMNGGDGYFYGEKAKENVEGCPRFGNSGNSFLANKHKSRLLEIVREDNFDNVSSFSGFTSEVFGKPKL
tara:strand:- start:313 stop:876 length:564 start_codon:yes stop_codon:yes gene_type:complete